tara:strand:+ start:526 stop:1779 length:1254 start_codon:yes stop_codon:yes gene_type:complete
MVEFRTIKGTHDLLPETLKFWKTIQFEITNIMEQYGYDEIRTPTFENTELFIRGIGTETDIVNKEMYSWVDQAGDTLTLKPELTAPIARAYVQNQLGNKHPLHRLYYFDTLFRRERPQKGRQRQFYQFGAEAIGSYKPEQDAEIISMAYHIYKNFNIKDMSVRLNSIGSPEIRVKYLDLLKNNLEKHIGDLCENCNKRLQKNALRIFDCKNQICQDLFDDRAPLIFDSISYEDSQHFDSITCILDAMDIPFKHDKKLVRGLDYYSHTTFEITSKTLGAQDALCGGGRYNNLIEKIGGKSTPAVGFAAGVERLILAIDKIKAIESTPDIYFITISEEASIIAFKLANTIRKKCNKKVILETLGRSLKAQLREANRMDVKHVVIIGEEELEKNMGTIKNMATSDQVQISFTDMVNFFNQ